MFYPPQGDLINWGSVATNILVAIANGRYSQASDTGVYSGLGLFLVPSVWVWQQLPINHPPIDQVHMLFGTSTPILLLAVLLKLPTLLADIGTGILVSRIVRRASQSVAKGRGAFLVWYLNPYNVYWINFFGGMDIIPAFIFMLGLELAISNRWLCSGIGLAIGTITRIFPLFSAPFLLLAVRERKRGIATFLLGLLTPLTVGVLLVLAIGAGTFTSIAATPENQYWLQDFLGYSLTNDYVKLTYVVLALQFFITFRYWRKPDIIGLATVSVLALLTAAQAYGGATHHFLWVSPLLTASMMLNPNERWVFILTFVAGCIAPSIFFPLPIFTDTLTWGAFWASKATYLLRINVNNITQDHSTK
jgi:hypothetical protein